MFEMIFSYFSAFPVLWTPVIALLLYLLFLALRLAAKKRNQKDPGTVSEAALKKYKTCTEVFGAIALITWVVIGGGALLLYEAVEHM